MAVQAILDSLDAYTGELDTLNAFTQTASRELGPDWTDKIYTVLTDLSDYQKEKLDHAFNYYAATTAWNEIQGYLTHDGPLNYQETVERLPILEHWLAFFGAAGEDVVSSLKSRLKLEGAASARDTSVLDEPFAPTAVSSVQPLDNDSQGNQNIISNASLQTQGDTVIDAEFEAVTDTPQNVRAGGEFQNTQSSSAFQDEMAVNVPKNDGRTVANEGAENAQTIRSDTIAETLPQSVHESELSENAYRMQNPAQTSEPEGVFLNEELDTSHMQQRINDIFSEDSSFEKTHKIVESNTNLSPDENLVEPDVTIDERPDALSQRAVQGDVRPEEVQQAIEETSQREMDNIFEESELNNFFQAADQTGQRNVQNGHLVETPIQEVEQNVQNGAQVPVTATQERDETDGSLAEFFVASAAENENIENRAVADAGFETTQFDRAESQMLQEQVVQPQIQNFAQPQMAPHNQLSENPPIIQRDTVQVSEQVRLTPESEEEFKVNRLLRQIDFKTAVQAWISARCIELGYTNNYTYRYYGFLVDVMDQTIEEIKEVLAADTLYDIVEQKKHDGIHFLQNQLIALEKESKDAHDRITSDLSPLPREGLSADDVRKALGQMDLSGEKEYLGPAPDGFEMLEDPYQSLDEATVKKEYAKIEAEADLPPAEPVKPVEPSDLKKPVVSTKSSSQTPQNGVQRKMSFSFGKKSTPVGSNNS